MRRFVSFACDANLRVGDLIAPAVSLESLALGADSALPEPAICLALCLAPLPLQFASRPGLGLGPLPLSPVSLNPLALASEPMALAAVSLEPLEAFAGMSAEPFFPGLGFGFSLALLGFRATCLFTASSSALVPESSLPRPEDSYAATSACSMSPLCFWAAAKKSHGTLIRIERPSQHPESWDSIAPLIREIANRSRQSNFRRKMIRVLP